MFEEFLAEIQKARRIIIHRHTNPDGDALGSQIGLYEILKLNFPGREVYKVGDEAGRYAFMDGSLMDEVPDALYENALAIVLDTSAEHLISNLRYHLAPRTARVDHHLFCGKMCDTEVIDSSFESCCGLIAEFARECGLKLNEKAAKALYTGMVTDSGRFRYDSVSARTLALASFLREQPFGTEDIYKNLYADSLENVKRRAAYTARISCTPHGVAYVYTDLETVKEMQMSSFSVARGLVNTMADIRGVNIWVSFTESEDGVLCELRASGVNINPVAVKYGGGGHAAASGATVCCRADAMAMLKDLDDIAKTL